MFIIINFFSEWPKNIASRVPPLGPESQYRKREKHTFKGNRASLGSTLRASTPATWDQTPPPNRTVTATEQKGSPASHLGPALAPLSPAPSPTKERAVSRP